MNFDDVVPYLCRGDFGKYQKRIYFLLCLPVILSAFHKLSGVFLLAVPDHRCRLDNESIDSPFELSSDVLNSSFPFDMSKNEFSKCEFIKESSNDSIELSKCLDYVWSTSKYESSAVKSFNMVCDKASWRASADSFMMLGVFIGSYAFGDLSDKFGRRPTLILSLFIQLLAGVSIAISPNLLTYTICRVIVGAASSGIFLVSFCLAVELVGKESRTIAGTVIQMFFSVGYLLIAFLAYFIHNWRWLQIAITIPGLFMMSYYYIIPESTRWLLSNNKKDKAIRQIQRVADYNDLKIPQHVLDKLQTDYDIANENDLAERKPSLLDLFKSPYLRTKSLLIFFDWFIITGSYYGLSWSTKNLGGNDHLNFAISGMVEFPALFFLMFSLNRLGRKVILAGSMIFSGLTLLLSLVIPGDYHWLIITLAMLGKMSITTSYGAIYVFSAEQFPTVIRNVALGAASMSGRVGSITAPYLIFLSEYWKPAPYFIIGICVLFGGLLSTFLPETTDEKLPETIADGERLGKDVEKSKVHEVEKLNL
ncbi:CLUMA_CG008641, isoform A [Clunio marinus]|uniref:CLUMA_CG008641, isoform A n=1 Tax=Clunio marinus TaxID=568069 RepID=A0A1J1I4T4_9DIPT|nr:CLUMA_CG008641, isoform A [Clunio marinus]